MILYFSATGNCKYIATKIAGATKNRLISITDCIMKENYSLHLSNGEQLGIVCPTYFWGLPSVVSEFFDQVKIDAKNSYIFFVSTYGETPGQTKKFMQKALDKNGLRVNAHYGIQMPDTWTPMFNLSDSEKLERINNKADEKLKVVIEKVLVREEGDFMHRKLPYFASKISNGIVYNNVRKTSHLALADDCIGCGQCAAKCPAHAIEMKENKPVWVKDSCAMCLGCLHRCPVNAIEYGKSKKHGQYQHPGVEI